MRRQISLALIGSFLVVGVAAAQTPGTASSPSPQTTTQSTSTTSNAGAFNKLSPGNQKIARALFQAQQTSQSPTSGAAKPLTLDQIAAMKQGGKGWGEIFHDLKAQGLVQEKNLGQVMSKYHHQQRMASSGTTATSRTPSTGGKGKPGPSLSSGRGGSGMSAAGGNGHGRHAGGNSGSGGGRGR